MYWIIFWLSIFSAVPLRAQAPGEVSVEDCQNNILDRCHIYASSQLASGEHMIQSAVDLLKANCKKGGGKSCFKIATILAGKQDKDSAVWFQLACEKGDTAGCSNLSKVQEKSKSVNQLVAQLRRACDGKLIQGCLNLAMIYVQQSNFNAAEKVYKEICNPKETRGCAPYGQLQENLGKLDRALEIFRTACNSGRKITCLWITAIETKRNAPAMAPASTAPAAAAVPAPASSPSVAPKK